MKGDGLKLLARLIADGVYGEITQPSDEPAVIDSELETYAPAEDEADGSRFHCF